MLKPISNTDQTTCISRFDSGIDHDASDWAKYAEVMYKNPAAWREHIKPKMGESLTEFVIGVVPGYLATQIDDECTSFNAGAKEMKRPDEMMLRYFLHGLRDIKNWQGGKPEMKDVDGVDYVDHAWLKREFSRGLRRVAIEIGHYVWAFNQLTGEEIKN